MLIEIKGGSGSGNFGHEGRPGERGGSGEGGDKFEYVPSGKTGLVIGREVGKAAQKYVVEGIKLIKEQGLDITSKQILYIQQGGTRSGVDANFTQGRVRRLYKTEEYKQSEPAIILGNRLSGKLDTFLHEYGHFVDWYLGGRKNDIGPDKKFRDDHYFSASLIKGVSNESAREMFAELFRVYSYSGAGNLDKIHLFSKVDETNIKTKFTEAMNKLKDTLTKFFIPIFSELLKSDEFVEAVADIIINDKLKSIGLQSLLKGGSGSGNFGHEGRPGERGGSGEGGGGKEYEWQGGKPSENDKFIDNAKAMGLKIKERYFDYVGDKGVTRSYITLDRSATLYHATTSDKIESIKKNGINPSIAKEGDKFLQVTGVYLGGKEGMSQWHGKDTVLVKVTLPYGTNLFQDVQPNAVFVENKIPSNWIKNEKFFIPITLKGGSGSGNFGHEGRPGEVGGSGEGGQLPKGIPESHLQGIKIKETDLGKMFPDQKVYGHWDYDSKTILIDSKRIKSDGLSYNEILRHEIGHSYWDTKLDQTKQTEYIQNIYQKEFLKLGGVKEEFADSYANFSANNKYFNEYPLHEKFFIDIFKNKKSLFAELLKSDKFVEAVADIIINDKLKSVGLQSVFKGGAESGNFGHEGNPGHVGGSGEGGEKPLLHGTTVANAKRIIKEGLRVEKANKDAWHDVVIFTTTKLNSAKAYGMGERSKGKYAIIHLNSKTNMQGDKISEDARVFRKDIPPEYISKVEIYSFKSQTDDLSHHILESTFKKSVGNNVILAIILNDEDKKSLTPITKKFTPQETQAWERKHRQLTSEHEVKFKEALDKYFKKQRKEVLSNLKKHYHKWINEIIIKGGSGSGNFGHEGRPGEVGGSGEGGGGGGTNNNFADKVTVIDSKYSKWLSSEINYLSTNYQNAIYHQIINENPLTIKVTDKLPIGRFGERRFIGDDKTLILISTDCYKEGGSKGLGNYILRHEIGHYVFDNLSDSLQNKITSLYEKNKDTVKYSFDMKKNDMEFFAESFSRLTGKEDPNHNVPKDIAKFINNNVLRINKKSLSGAITKADDQFNFEKWVFDNAQWNDELSAMGGEFIKEMYDQIGTEVFDGLKYKLGDIMEGSWDVTNPSVQEFLDQYSMAFAEKVNDTIGEDLKDTIGPLIAEGESIDTIAEAVGNLYDGWEGYKSELIARTETIRASNAGAEESYRQSGVVIGKEWLVTEDDRTCDACMDMAEEVRDIDDNFAEGDDPEDAYNDIPYPPLHPNCRCALIPVIDSKYENPEEYLASEEMGLSRLLITLKGGSGSGNFGHEGRPGERGGSGEGGGKEETMGGIFYRGSTYQVAVDIKTEGIKRGESWYGRPPSVYVCSSPEEASTYAQLMTPDKAYGIAEIHIPTGIEIITDKVDVDFGAERSFRIEQDIPKEWIKSVKFYDKDGDFIYQRSKNFKIVYYPILLSSSKKYLASEEMGLSRIMIMKIGTESSGNYGHEGRPGEVGGSGGGGGEAYHGTSVEHAESIINEGIKLRNYKEVFASPRFSKAMNYAYSYTHISKVKEVAIVVVSKSAFKEQSRESWIMERNKDLPPKYIYRVEVYSAKDVWKYFKALSHVREEKEDTVQRPTPLRTIQGKAKKEISDEVYCVIVPKEEKSIKGGSGSGNFGHEGNPGHVGGSGEGGGEKLDRVERAKASYVPATKELQDIADHTEKEVTSILGGERFPDNSAFDIRVGKTVIELKTIITAKEDRVHMRKECRERKEQWLNSNKGHRGIVIAVDKREKDKAVIYYKKEIGAFRFGSMKKVEAPTMREALNKIPMGKKEIGLSSIFKIGTETSGNYGHEGRPGEVGGSGEGGKEKLSNDEIKNLLDPIFGEKASIDSSKIYHQNVDMKTNLTGLVYPRVTQQNVNLLPIKNFNIDKLFTREPQIKRQTLEKKLRGENTQLPLIVEKKGRLFIFDGNHTVAAAIVRREKTIEGRYFNTGKRLSIGLSIMKGVL